MNRRSFLHLAGASSMGLSLLLDACGPGAAAGPGAVPQGSAPTPLAPAAGASGSSAAKLKLPTYVPNQVPPPDLPPTPAGLQAGYFTYPKQLLQSVANPPGLGSDVTALMSTSFAAPPPVDQNPAWQAINKAVNANMHMQPIPTADYPTKVGTTMAGGDPPDLLYLDNSSVTISGIPQFLKSAYADLTPFLGGDAVKDYPNLAALPSNPWKQTVYDGAILAIPIVRPYIQWVWFVNQSRLDSVGAAQPANGDDLKRILKELTRPQDNQWGIGAVPPGYGLLNPGGSPHIAMFGGPNNWAVDANGKFSKDLETEQFAAALGYVHDLYAAGYYYPDNNMNNASIKTNFLAGKFSVFVQGWASYQTILWDPALQLNPPIKVRTFHPFSNDGGTPIWHQYFGLIGQTSVKKGSADRITELLRILNFMAAPFGSQEYHLIYYGVQGDDFGYDSQGNPVPTQKGLADVNVGWNYLATSSPVLFDPNDAGFVKTAYADEQAMVPYMIQDPSIGLFSPTDANKGAQLTQKFLDGIGDIITGRSPISGLDQLIKDWQSNGGAQIRSEYQQAYSDSMK